LDILDFQNTQRLIRALEVCIGTGKKFSSFKEKRQNKRDFIPIKIGLNLPKEKLHENINSRVDKMMENGFLEEAIRLYSYRENNALQTVGYKELFDYLENKTSLEEAVELIKLHTRQYAKRQLTFFNKHKDYIWFEPQQMNEILQYIKNNI
jgi:tRNA dimethylallyltransferase